MTKEISDFMKDIYHDEKSEKELLKMLVRRHGGLYNYFQIVTWEEGYEQIIYYHIPPEWSGKMKCAAHDIISLCHDYWLSEVFSFEPPSALESKKVFEVVLDNWNSSKELLRRTKKSRLGLKNTYQTPEDIVDCFKLIFDEMMGKASNFKLLDESSPTSNQWTESRPFPQAPLFVKRYDYSFECDGKTICQRFVVVKVKEGPFPPCFDEPLDVKLREIIFHRLKTGKCFPL